MYLGQSPPTVAVSAPGVDPYRDIVIWKPGDFVDDDQPDDSHGSIFPMIGGALLLYLLVASK